jgi:hypothetical protein
MLITLSTGRDEEIVSLKMDAVNRAISMVSVVLPCLNELRHGYLPKILENLAASSKAIMSLLRWLALARMTP